MDVIEQVFSTVLDKTLTAVPQSEKLFSGQLSNIDILVMNDRLGTFADQESSEQMLMLCNELWLNLLAGLLDKNYLPESCPSSLQFSWPAVFNRLLNVYAVIDPGASGMDSITSLSSMYSRAPKKISNMGDIRLWRNYLVFACCTHPKTPPSRSESPDQDGGTSSEGSDKVDSRPPSPHMVDSLFRFAVPLLKSDCPKIREAIISGLGRTSPSSYRDFIEEIHFLVREALDRRAESVRKRRKRDSLRSYLTKVFELNAQYGCFSDSDSELVTDDGLISFFKDYIDGIRLYLESEPDKDWPAIMHLRLYFCNFVYKLITSVSKSHQESLLPRDLRCNLFFLFSSWCAHFGVKTSGVDKTLLIPSAQSNDLELATLHAMCGILQCGQVFDHDGLSTSGYLYSWLKLVLNSPKEKIHLLGRNTLTCLLENNSNCPNLLHWVIEKCYTGTKLVASGCFRALCSVLTKRTDYPCEMIPLLNVVLFKTADTCIDLREKAAQLLQILERRFFKYTQSSISCSAHCSYSQSQSELSAALAKAHPEITVYMFEEMTSRFQSTTPAGQRCILQYMLPWLANIELVDLANPPSLPNMEVEVDQEQEDQPELMPPVELTGEGWGSVEATRLVLNNLFYITVKYDDHFSKEIESAWASLVCSEWTDNVHEILSYLITLAGVVGQSEVLVHAKKLAVYIARAQTDQTVDELMEELKLTETIASQFERSDEPPYFKVVNKTSCSSDSVCEQTNSKKTTQSVDKDAKQQEEAVKKETKEEKKSDSLPRNSSLEKGSSTDQPEMAPLAEPEDVEDDNKVEPFEDACWPQEWVFRVHKSGGALPLPVADRQKYYAPLDDVLPFASTAASLYRCNFALMVLTELVLDQPQVEWSRHVPLMLHLIFLGLDHGKVLVYEHCKRLLVNLVIIVVCHGNYIHIAQPLSDFMAGSEQSLGKHGQLQKSVWTLDIGSMVRIPDSIETSAGAGDIGKTKTGNDADGNGDGSESEKFTAGGELTSDEENEKGKFESVKSLIEFLSNSISKPLWSFEDITPRNYKIKSAEQMEIFLALVIHIFSTCDVGSSVQRDWAKVALQWATTCSSRHYAGRSFQVFRALKVPLSWPMLSDVLSRLVESVGDTSEDVQGYVMEILLTLEACTDWTMYDSAGDGPGRPTIPYGRDQDDKDLDQYDELANVLSPLGTPGRTPLSSRSGLLNNDNLSIRHIRSLSSGCDIRRALGFYAYMGRINNQNNDILRARSASVQCLRMTGEVSQQTDMITRVFWIAVSLFESDYDHEYLMAVELLNQVMTFLNLGRPESRDRLEKVLHRLNWTEFPGLQALVLKGLTSAGTSDVSLRLLARLTEFTDVAIVDPSQVSGFGLNILALLSYMAEHFDEPDEFSRTCAANIVQVCCRTNNLANLGKMFRMYTDKTYHRPRSTWIDVVCKYIHDSFSRYSKSYVTFLLEVLEYGPQSYQESVLAILCALIKQIDFSSVGMRQFHNNVLKVISRYLKGNYWKESLEILKIAVSNSSNLDTPPPRPKSTVWSNYDSSWAIDALPVKKELPGRTLEFTYDLSSVPVIGAKSAIENTGEQSKITADIPAPRKPNTSQKRTRERLVHVLQTCGHTVGLKQSPSVVFSSSSDLAVEKHTDHQSSNEDVNNESRKEDQIMGVLTNFDFLDDVSIDSNDESGFGMWTVEESRRYENHETQSIDKGLLQVNSFSGSDLDLTTPHDSSDEDDELNRSMNDGSVSTTCAAVESESAAESAAESVGDLESSVDQEVTIETSNEGPESTSTESAVGTSPSGRGEYHFYAVTEAPNMSDDIEILWSEHISAIVKDTTGVTAVNTYALFWSLYKSTRRKFYSLTRECCNYLDEKFRDVSQHFCNTLEFLVARGDCPYVCLDTETLKKSRLFDKQKFMTLELNDHYLNYVTNSNKTTENLDLVKLAIKRSSVGSHNEEPDVYSVVDKVALDQRQLDLCRSLYQMHFQFLLLCCTYCRLMETMVKGAQTAKINDYTNKASSIRAEIASVLEHLPQITEQPNTLTSDLENLTQDAAIQQLTDRLISKDVEQAIYLLRTFREKFDGERFGKSDDDNLDLLLTIFCRQTADKDVGSLVMSSQPTQFSCLCNELMDVNLSALAALDELVFP